MGGNLRLSARAFIPAVGTVPYIGTYFDSGSGFNFHYVGMFTGAQEMSGPMTTPTASFVEEPALSPDGTLVAFIQAGQIYTIEPDGTNLQGIYLGTDPDWEGTVTFFQWAPDSSHILFTVWFGAFAVQNKIFTVPRNGGGITTLYTHVNNNTTGAQSYNDSGTKIIFAVVASSSSSQVWVVDADGTNATQIETVPTQFSNPRSGQWEAFSDDRYVWNDGTLASTVWKAKNIDGSGTVTIGSGNSFFPRRMDQTWNPDGSGYLVWNSATTTDINTARYDGSGLVDYMTLDINVTANLFVTRVTRFFNRVWWDSANQIWSAPLSDLTDQRDETINGDGVGVNFGLSG